MAMNDDILNKFKLFQSLKGDNNTDLSQLPQLQPPELLSQPEQPEIMPFEAPQAPTTASVAQPMPEPQDPLIMAQEEKQGQLRNLGLLQAAQQIGQSLAGRYSGQFKADTSGVNALRSDVEQRYKDFLEKRKAKEDKEAAKVYRDVIKEKLPNLEISENVSADHLKALLTNFGKAQRAFSQSQYMTTEGDPVSFDPTNNKYINTLTGQPIVNPGNLIRNYTKTVTDPKTGEIIEIRPGVGAVGTVAGAPTKSAKTIGQSDMKDYTYEMLNPKQREFFTKTEEDYAKDIKDSREFGEILVNVEDLIDSDISAGIPAIKRQLARSVGKEVGVMTDKDVAAFSGDQSLMGAMERFAKLQATGKMTEEDKKQFKEIIGIANRNIDKAIENRSGYHISRLRQRIPDATPSSMRSLLSVQASKPIGIDQENDPTIKDYANKYKLNYKQAEKILTDRGYKKGK